MTASGRTSRWSSRREGTFGFVRARVALVVALGLALLPSPGGAEATSTAASKPTEEPVMTFIPASGSEIVGRVIKSGVRIERTSAGLSIARERFDSGGEAQGVLLPGWLGGGYLFSHPTAEPGSPSTALYRAEDWTGPLRPLALLPFAVEQVIVGFDRVYLLASGLRIALDPDTGEVLPLGPLPPLVTFRQLRFLGPESALVWGPLVGLLETRDAGLTWSSASEQVPPERDPDLEDDARAMMRAEIIEAGRLRDVILRGIPTDTDHVVGLVDGQVWTLSRAGLSIAASPAPGLDPASTCQGTPGTAPGTGLFLCQGTATQAFELRVRKGEESAIRKIGELRPARPVLAVSAEGVLVRGACEGNAEENQGCVIQRTGARTVGLGRAHRREVFAFRGGGVERVFLGQEGALHVRKLGDSGAARVLRIPQDDELRQLLLRGNWVRGADARTEGLSFWVTHGERFAGVFLGDESGDVEVGPIQQPLRRALLSGRRGLVWGAAGFARLTTDGGLTYDEVHFPYRSGDLDPTAPVGEAAPVVLGCGAAGCSLGSWLVWGFRPGQSEPSPALPAPTPLPPPGGGKFRFDCVATGDASPAPPRGHVSEEDLPSEAFWEVEEMRVGPGDEAVSVADSRGLARLTTWGPKDLPWADRGRSQVVFRDRYRVSPLSWSARTPGLYIDAVRAKEALGLLDPSTQLVVSELSASGRAGVMFVRTRQETALLGFSEGGALSWAPIPEELHLRSVAGVVEHLGTFLIGSLTPSDFRVIELRSEGPKVLLSFPASDVGHRDVQLVKSTSGALGVAMDGDDGLFVYPISAQGELGDPIVVPHEGSRPEECAPEATGYVVERELSVAPYVESRGNALDVDRIRLRLVVGYGPACIDAMAGETRGPLEGATVERGALGVSLVVADLARGGRRIELACQ